jgi:hypothetical protein
VGVTQPVLLSIVVLAIFALVGGGAVTIVRRGERMRGTLMIVAAAVLLGNLLIWTWPVG